MSPTRRNMIGEDPERDAVSVWGASESATRRGHHLLTLSALLCIFCLSHIHILM